MQTLQVSDLEEGESYYDKDYSYEFSNELYTMDKTIDVKYWLGSVNDMFVLLERHPADQRTESKSIKVVSMIPHSEFTITDVSNLNYSNPTNTDKYNTAEEELNDHTAEITDAVYYEDVGILDISVSGNTLNIDVREVDGSEYTIHAQK